MRIESLSPMMARNLLAALPKAGPNFRMAEEEPHGPAANAMAGPGTTPPPNVQMLVAIAVTNPAIERRRKLARHAERGIDALDRLHKELVAGAPSPARLQEILDWSQNVEVPENPVLASLLSEIDLRVRVELAKFDVQA